MPELRERVENLSNRALAVNLMTEVDRLNALDDLWTRVLDEDQAESQLQSELPTLESLVGEMIHLLSSIGPKSRELSQLVQEFPRNLDEVLEQLLQHHPSSSELRDSRPDGPFAQAIIDACQTVASESPAEMALLASKLERIAAGQFESGDLRRFFKCALFVVGAGAALMSVVASGGLVALPAAAVVGSGVVGVAANGLMGWNGWQCKNAPPPSPSPATG
jgi:hypothetical protein